MRTTWIWSVSLGRWWGVHLRLHLFFFLFAAFVVYVTSQPFSEPNWLGFVCPLVLFASVLLHEIAHVVVARRLGGIADEIVLSPLGGLAPVRVPYEPHSELVANMAGIFVNAAVCCFTALALVSLEGKANLGELVAIAISYLDNSQELTAANVVRLVFWLNWSLLLVNLLPVFPFDGSRSLKAILGFLWPELDTKQATLSVVRLGKIASVLLLVLAWYQFKPTEQTVQPPAWLALALLSIYVYFCSRLEELQLVEAEQDDETVFGYDFSAGYTSLERSLDEEEEKPDSSKAPSLGLFRAWLARRRAEQERRRREQEVEDERRVDEILAQLHAGGMSSLSADDRALLERVSRRYRSRPAQ